MAEVEFRNVSKVFPGESLALEDFDLKIDDGEFLVILGPSGCGKSTALRLVAGLERVTKGEILIDGEVVNELSPQQRNIAMVFQNYALYPHKTVRGNLDFPLRMMGLSAPEREERIEETAAILGLEGYLDRKPRHLSGGQRQRTAMGRALVRDPQVSLMDEPLSNLDAKLRVEIRSEIARLQAKLGITTIYVTHDQVEAMTLGDRVAVLNAGRLQQVDTPQRIYLHPCNVFVATFIGSPGMNVFRTRLTKKGDRYLIRLGQQELSLQPRRRQEFPEVLEDYLGQEILAGLRPEAFSKAERAGSAPRITGTVTSGEDLGHERILYLDVSADLGLPQKIKTNDGDERAKEQLAVRLPTGPPLDPGEEIQLTVDTSRLYFFTLEGDALTRTLN